MIIMANPPLAGEQAWLAQAVAANRPEADNGPVNLSPFPRVSSANCNDIECFGFLMALRKLNK